MIIPHERVTQSGQRDRRPAQGARADDRVAESSAGGLINAALVAVPGASGFYLGGAIIYTKVGRKEIMGISSLDVKGIRSASEPYARLLAQRVREKLGATWGLSETGRAGRPGTVTAIRPAMPASR